jgi:DNA replication protein DnaC
MNAEVLAAQVKLYARELKMPGLAGAFEEIVRDAAKAGRAQLETLAVCLAAEIASRAEHRLAARIKAARFPALKSFESFDFTLLLRSRRGAYSSSVAARSRPPRRTSSAWGLRVPARHTSPAPSAWR